MATINVEIGKQGKSKQRNVCFLVRQGNTKKRIPTELMLEESDLSRNGKKIKNARKAMLVEQMRRKIQDKLYEISIEWLGQEVDAEYITSRLISHLANRSGLDFFRFAEQWLEQSKVKDKKNYKSMLNKLEEYAGGRSLPFSRIDYEFLLGFEIFLKGKPRAQSHYLGLMRHLYREAMRRYNDDHTMLISNDPFLRYRVPKQKMKLGVRALTLEELLKIYSYENPRPTSRAQLARDCFILSFCLMGMNSVDMHAVTDCKGGVIRYNRAKTKDRRSDGAYIEVRVHPLLRGLMEKYRDKSRVFRFYRRYGTAVDFNRNLNVGLKEVGRAVGINGLQFYQARHTFATLSRNLMRFSKSDVDEALNHVGTMEIADVYIKKDFSIINENNFKLIEEVFKWRT